MGSLSNKMLYVGLHRDPSIGYVGFPYDNYGDNIYDYDYDYDYNFDKDKLSNDINFNYVYDFDDNGRLSCIKLLDNDGNWICTFDEHTIDDKYFNYFDDKNNNEYFDNLSDYCRKKNKN